MKKQSIITLGFVSLILIIYILYSFVYSNHYGVESDDENIKIVGETTRGKNVLNWIPPRNAMNELKEEWSRAVIKAREDIALFDLGGSALRYKLKETKNEMETLYRLLFGSGASRGEF